jgi:hypothetical protein
MKHPITEEDKRNSHDMSKKRMICGIYYFLRFFTLKYIIFYFHIYFETQFVITSIGRFRDGVNMLQMERNSFVTENAANNNVFLEERTPFFSGRKMRIMTFLMIIVFLFSSICAETAHCRNILRKVRVRVRINKGHISIRRRRKKQGRVISNASLKDVREDVKPPIDHSLDHNDGEDDETENFVINEFVGNPKQTPNPKAGNAITAQNQKRNTATPTPTPTPRTDAKLSESRKSRKSRKGKESKKEKTDDESKTDKSETISKIIFGITVVVAVIALVVTWYVFHYAPIVPAPPINGECPFVEGIEDTSDSE